MVEHKDIVLGVVAASAALAGLVLVFLGLVIGAYAGLEGDDPASVKAPYKRTGVVLLAAFMIGLACVAASTVWLVDRNDNHVLYAMSVVLFAAQILSLAVATVWTTKELLWD